MPAMGDPVSPPDLALRAPRSSIAGDVRAHTVPVLVNDDRVIADSTSHLEGLPGRAVMFRRHNGSISAGGRPLPSTMDG